MTESMRVDARRNYSRILDVAQAEVAVHGAEVSFEKIARESGVGSATVHRHFPTRQSLMYAVFHHRINGLCARAAELPHEKDYGRALLTFLENVLDYCVDSRGLAITLVLDNSEGGNGAEKSCSRELDEAARPLVSKAVRAGAVRSDVTAAELLALIVGIALSTESSREPRGAARRLLTLATVGLLPRD